MECFVVRIGGGGEIGVGQDPVGAHLAPGCGGHHARPQIFAGCGLVVHGVDDDLAFPVHQDLGPVGHGEHEGPARAPLRLEELGRDYLCGRECGPDSLVRGFLAFGDAVRQRIALDDPDDLVQDPVERVDDSGQFGLDVAYRSCLSGGLFMYCRISASASLWC